MPMPEPYNMEPAEYQQSREAMNSTEPRWYDKHVSGLISKIAKALEPFLAEGYARQGADIIQQHKRDIEAAYNMQPPQQDEEILKRTQME